MALHPLVGGFIGYLFFVLLVGIGCMTYMYKPQWFCSFRRQMVNNTLPPYVPHRHPIRRGMKKGFYRLPGYNGITDSELARQYTERQAEKLEMAEMRTILAANPVIAKPTPALLREIGASDLLADFAKKNYQNPYSISTMSLPGNLQQASRQITMNNLLSTSRPATRVNLLPASASTVSLPAPDSPRTQIDKFIKELKSAQLTNTLYGGNGRFTCSSMGHHKEGSVHPKGFKMQQDRMMEEGRVEDEDEGGGNDWEDLDDYMED